MSYYTYVTFKDLKNNLQAVGNTYNPFNTSSIAKLFLNNSVLDNTERLTRIFNRKYGLRFWYSPVEVSNNSINYENIYNELVQSIEDIDLELTYKYEKLVKTLTLEYNPIWNKDGKITHTYTRTPNLSTADTGTLTSETKYGLTQTVTPDLEDTTNATAHETTTPTVSTQTSTNSTVTDTPKTTTTETPAVSTTVTNSVSPYDTTDLTVRDSQTTTPAGNNTTTVTGTDTQTSDSTVTVTQSGTDKTETDSTVTQKHTGETVTANSGSDTVTNSNSNTRLETGTDNIQESTLEQGNIGVTTTQSMIQEERNIADYSVIDEYLRDVIKYVSLGTYCI